MNHYMKLRTPQLILLTVFVVFLLSGSVMLAQTAGQYNLIKNPSFEITTAGGDPSFWLRGSYGANTPHYAVVPCRPYSTFRPGCPPDTLSALSVSVSDYHDGDAKWYFDDVVVGANKKFTLSYQFQAYNHRSRAVARYTFAPGVYRYELLGNMVPPKAGGQGYVAWKSASHEFTAPKGATSFTVFFAVGEDGVCDTPCTDSDRGGTLSIANVVLKQ